MKTSRKGHRVRRGIQLNSLRSHRALRESMHYKFPLASCSLSNASKSALKFPLPKLLAPLR